MARRGIPSLLIGLVTLLNGTVMLLGPGLHGLPGCGHGAIANRAAGTVDEGLGVVSDDCTSAESCPLCDYLTQGQVVVDRVLLATSEASAFTAPVPAPPTPHLRPSRTFGCRAPPAFERV
jgi:hypothetical protein